MKHTIPLFLILFPFLGLAQTKSFIGIKAGGELSSAYFDHTLAGTFINTTVVPGIHGGLIYKLFTNQGSGRLNAGLQTGIGFTQRGWKQVFPSDEPSYTTRMGYLEVPLEALVYFGKRKTKGFFTLGIYLDHLLSVENSTPPNPANLGGADFYPYVRDRDRTFGYGGKGSIGFQGEYGFGTIHLDAHFNFSLRSMLEHDTFDTFIPDLSNHFGAGFTVAYLIPFGKMEF